MKLARTLSVVALALAPAIGSLVACGGGAAIDSGAKPKVASKEGFKNATRCDTQKEGNEVSYHDLSGRGRADMIQVVGYTRRKDGVAEGHVVCVELDTNHDGTLDLVRLFNDKGLIESEEADRNYDGKSDVWITYEDGLVTKQVFDDTFHGEPDEWQYFRPVCVKTEKDGTCPEKRAELKRTERDRNGDGKVDTWEFYVADANGLPKLERIGVDLDGDGKVDEWYRDEAARTMRAQETKPATSPSTAPSGSATGKRKEALPT